MNKQLEITKELGKDSWGLKGMTGEEIRAIHEAVNTAHLPAARKLQSVKELLEETFNTQKQTV